jgi:hypothetical protein
MSSTVAAYAVLGVPIDTSDLYERETRSVHLGCQTPHVGQFCAECGWPVDETETIETPMEGYDREGGKNYGGMFRGLEIIKGRWGDDCEGRTFLAAAYAKDDTDGYDERRGPGRMPQTDWFVAMNRVREVLEPVGLWNAQDFGIWVVAYYS